MGDVITEHSIHVNLRGWAWELVLPLSVCKLNRWRTFVLKANAWNEEQKHKNKKSVIKWEILGSLANTLDALWSFFSFGSFNDMHEFFLTQFLLIFFHILHRLSVFGTEILYWYIYYCYIHLRGRGKEKSDDSSTVRKCGEAMYHQKRKKRLALHRNFL